MIDWLNHIPLAGLMLVVAAGYTLGRISWRGVAVGPAGGTLLLALFLGHLGLDLDRLYGSDQPELTIGAFGFALFIYSVGFEAGPRFFSSLLGGPGWRFVVIALMVNASALGLAVACGLLFQLGEAVTAGLLSGALTSVPTFAAAQAVSSDPAALSVTFALTYPIGLIALVLMIQYLPRRLGQQLGTDGEEIVTDPQAAAAGPELTRVFEVQSEALCGKTLADLDLSHATGCWITGVHRDSEIGAPRADTVLELGDHLMVRGRLEELKAFRDLVGPEVYDQDLRGRMPSPRRLVVTQSSAIGKTLRELDLTTRFRCMVIELIRGGVGLEPRAELVVERGDVLRIVGPRAQVKRAAAALGRLERPSAETDVAVYAGGILVGLLIGQIAIRLGGFDLTLGTAGGLLLAGILLGRFRTIGSISTHVPTAARQLVRDLGILLFVAETGVRAGLSSFGLVQAVIGPALIATLVVVVGSVLITLLLVRVFLRQLPHVDVWGSIGGGMTSSSALVALRRAAEGRDPALSYAAAYAVASVFVTMAGQLIVWWMS